MIWQGPTTAMRIELVLAGSGEVVVVHASGGVVIGVPGSSRAEEANETRRNDGSRRWRCTSVATGRGVDVWTGWGVPYPRPHTRVVSFGGFYTSVPRRDATLRADE